jgi:hypothetical protein
VAGDSPSQWNQESAVLISLFHQEAKGATIIHPVSKSQTSVAMTAFADDTTIHGNTINRQKSPTEMALDVQDDLTHWNEFLHAAGHFLELSKCACYFIIWGFDEDGRPIATPNGNLGVDIKIRQRDDTLVNIQQLSVEDGQKTLGVIKCPSGSQSQEINRLRAKSDGIARRVKLSSLTRTESQLAYETSYIPAMRYPLTTTSIHQSDMEKIQQQATAAFLSKMGYNRNMPREVVFGHKLHQGLGFRHLFDMQGIDGTIALLQELNSHSSTNTILMATIQTIQIKAGISSNIFEDTTPLEDIPWSWLMRIRDFLQHMNADIRGIPITTIPLYREHDKHIMEIAINSHRLTVKEL